MDPSGMPWRSIDAAAPATEPPAAEPGGSVVTLSRGTLAALAGTVLVAVATFLFAFGSGNSGVVEVAGGASLGGPATSGPTGSGSAAGLASQATVELVVEIVGAVERPGVYRLPTGSRVGDLLDAAGGYGPRVDTDGAARTLNLAALLADGDQIRVPSRDDAAAVEGTAGPVGGSAGSGSGAAAAPLDLNRATNAELEALPGIGPVTAAKIISSREETRLTSVDDLLTRKLVGQKTFDGLRELVTVH